MISRTINSKYGKILRVDFEKPKKYVFLVPFSRVDTTVDELREMVKYYESLGNVCIVDFETENIICTKRESKLEVEE